MRMAKNDEKYTNVDFEKAKGLRDQSGARWDHMGTKMMQELGLIGDNLDQDMHLLLTYETPERYVECLDGQMVVYDMANPFSHGLINLSRIVHNMDPQTQTQMYGIGEAKPNEILQSALNDMWSDTVNIFNMQKQPVIAYREGMDPDKLVWTPGNRIGIPPSMAPISSDFMLIPGQQITMDHFQMPQTMERYMDLTAKSFAPQRGEVGAGNATATEVAVTKSVGDKTQEQVVKTGELLFMKDFGQKCLSHIEQFMQPADVISIVGPQKAQFWFTGNPANIPGGYSFSFKGSDRLAEQMVRQNSLRNILPFLQQLLTSGQLTLAQMVMDSFGFKQDDIMNISREAVSMMMIQRQMQIMQMQQDAEVEKAKIASKEKKDGKGYNGNEVDATASASGKSK
jgi:hypothetical protein